MRLSSVWSDFSKRDVEQSFFTNSNFGYQVSFETNDYDVKVRYFKINGANLTEVKKDDIPQTVFSAMLQNDNWTKKEC